MATFEPLHFRLKPIEATITKDSKGRPLRAVTVEAIDDAERERAAVKERSERDKIIAAMATATPLDFTSVKQIGVAAGLILPAIDRGHADVRRLQRLINDMIEERLIEKTGGYYLLTKKGRAHAVRLGDNPS